MTQHIAHHVTRRVHARHDPTLGARIVRATPLHYAAGADAALDRPVHVRAGSGVAWFGERLAVVQDDAHFVALVDARDASVASVTLPAGAGGRRQFGDAFGNKADKLDLEAVARVPSDDGAPWLLALGSGSTARRESAILLRAPRMECGDGAADVTDAVVVTGYALPAFYARLRAAAGIAGSELNVEGALYLGSGAETGRLRLFNRGNGAPRGDRVAVNATCDVDWPAFAAHLASPATTETPAPFDVVAYDLGAIDGLALTFTDAAVVANTEHATIVYTAAAEASPDATRDGPVAGCAIGVIEHAPLGIVARWALLRDDDGRPFTGKVEGIATHAHDRTRAVVVVDRDAHDVASDLCEVALDGAWFV